MRSTVLPYLIGSYYRRYILLTKTTAALNEVALSYRKMSGLCLLSVVFAVTIDMIINLSYANSLWLAFIQIFKSVIGKLGDEFQIP